MGNDFRQLQLSPLTAGASSSTACQSCSTGTFSVGQLGFAASGVICNPLLNQNYYVRANFAENNSTYSSADQSIFVWAYQNHQADGGSIFQWVFGPQSSFGGATNILAYGNCLNGACSVRSILDWNEIVQDQQLQRACLYKFYSQASQPLPLSRFLVLIADESKTLDHVTVKRGDTPLHFVLNARE